MARFSSSGLWILLSLLGFAQSTCLAKGCQVKWKKAGYLRGSECTQKKGYVLIKPCHSQLVCRASTKNVQPDPNPCDDPSGPSAPSFEAYNSGDIKKITAYLASRSNVPVLAANTEFSEQKFTEFLKAKAGQNGTAEVVVTLPEPAYTAYMAALEKSAGARQALERHNIRRIYFVAADAPGSLSAFDVTSAELVKAPATEPPSCGD